MTKERSFTVPHISATTNKAVRFPDTMIEAIETQLVGTGCTFSRFVVEAVRYVLEHIEATNTDND